MDCYLSNWTKTILGKDLTAQTSSAMRSNGFVTVRDFTLILDDDDGAKSALKQMHITSLADQIKIIKSLRSVRSDETTDDSGTPNPTHQNTLGEPPVGIVDTETCAVTSPSAANIQTQASVFIKVFDSSMSSWNNLHGLKEQDQEVMELRFDGTPDNVPDGVTEMQDLPTIHCLICEANFSTGDDTVPFGTCNRTRGATFFLIRHCASKEHKDTWESYIGTKFYAVENPEIHGMTKDSLEQALFTSRPNVLKTLEWEVKECVGTLDVPVMTLVHSCTKTFTVTSKMKLNAFLACRLLPHAKTCGGEVKSTKRKRLSLPSLKSTSTKPRGSETTQSTSPSSSSTSSLRKWFSPPGATSSSSSSLYPSSPCPLPPRPHFGQQ
jgi:hypothetical protein